MQVKAAVLAAVIAALFGFSSGPASAAQVSCGQVITQDTKVDNDLIDCPGDGILIGVAADDVTVDLNGHTIDGVGVGRGVVVGTVAGVPALSGPVGVTVVNGAVRDFQDGIRLNGAIGTRLRKLTVSANARAGVDIKDDFFGSMEQSRVIGNGAAGIGLDLSVLDRVENNVVSNNGSGIVGGRGSALIEGNLISGNALVGIAFSPGPTLQPVQIQQNVVMNNGYSGGCCPGVGDGLLLRGFASRELIARNKFLHNRDHGIALDQLAQPQAGQDNRIIDNTASENGLSGIFLAFNATGNLIEGNTANRNRDDGIHIDGPVDPSATGNTVTRNKANRNIDLGIEVIPSTIDGGGNRAFGNDNPLQCLNVSCK